MKTLEWFPQILNPKWLSVLLISRWNLFSKMKLVTNLSNKSGQYILTQLRLWGSCGSLHMKIVLLSRLTLKKKKIISKYLKRKHTKNQFLLISWNLSPQGNKTLLIRWQDLKMSNFQSIHLWCCLRTNEFMNPRRAMSIMWKQKYLRESSQEGLWSPVTFRLNLLDPCIKKKLVK